MTGGYKALIIALAAAFAALYIALYVGFPLLMELFTGRVVEVAVNVARDAQRAPLAGAIGIAGLVAKRYIATL